MLPNLLALLEKCAWTLGLADLHMWYSLWCNLMVQIICRVDGFTCWLSGASHRDMHALPSHARFPKDDALG